MKARFLILKLIGYLRQIFNGSIVDHYRVLMQVRSNLDKEIDFLSFLCDKTKISIDVGAAVGVYTYYILKFSSFCYCFEVNDDRAKRLKKIFPARRVKVETIALSNKKNTAVLSTPIENGIPRFGRASIENENDFTGMKTKRDMVSTERLDSFVIKNVGFIKIDVEGHELAVLEGARELLVSESPNILIEAEDRHKKGAVGELSKFLFEIGYTGIFLFNNNFYDLKHFELDIHQNVEFISDKNLYTNNFIFSKSIETLSSIKCSLSL